MALGKASKKALKDELERLEEEQEQRNGSQNDVKWMKLQTGENLLRFLPPWSDEIEIFWHRAGIHYGLPNPKDPSKNTAYGCLEDYGEECPICEEVKRLYSSKDEGNVEKAKKMTRKKRIYYNVLDINEPDKGVQILGVGPSIHEEIVSYFNEYGDITDLEVGYNLKIIKKVDPTKSKLFGTTYKVRIDRDPSKVNPKLIPDIEENVGPLETVLPKPSVDDLLESLGKKSKKQSDKRSVDDDGDDEEAYRRSIRRKKLEAKRKAAEADEDEDDAPREKKSKKRDDDEDEKPRKKKSKAIVDDDEDELEKELKDMDVDDEKWEDWDDDEDDDA